MVTYLCSPRPVPTGVLEDDWSHSGSDDCYAIGQGAGGGKEAAPPWELSWNGRIYLPTCLPHAVQSHPITHNMLSLFKLFLHHKEESSIGHSNHHPMRSFMELEKCLLIYLFLFTYRFFLHWLESFNNPRNVMSRTHLDRPVGLVCLPGVWNIFFNVSYDNN